MRPLSLVFGIASTCLLVCVNADAGQSGAVGQPEVIADATTDATVTRSIQNELGRLGYYAGPMDGRGGGKTEAAIRKYQHDKGLPVDGQPSARLWSFMQSASRQGYRGATSLDEAHRDRNGTSCCR